MNLSNYSKDLHNIYDYFPNKHEQYKNTEIYNKYINKKINMHNIIFREYINKLKNIENDVDNIIQKLDNIGLFSISEFKNENLQFNKKKFKKNISDIVDMLVQDSVLIDSLLQILNTDEINIDKDIHFEDIVCYKSNNNNIYLIEAISFSLINKKKDYGLLNNWYYGNNIHLSLRFYKGEIDMEKILYMNNEIKT